MGVRLSDGTVLSLEALAVSSRMAAHAGFPAALWLRPAEHPAGIGNDATSLVEALGVWVAGNVTDLAAQLGTAAAAGAVAAGAVAAARSTPTSQMPPYAARSGTTPGAPGDCPR